MFCRLYDQQAFTDVTLTCAGRSFAVHKMILITCSTFFYNTFLHNLSKHPLILLVDIPAKYMEELLSFMSRGEINIHLNELSPFLKIAKRLQIKGLYDEIQNTSSTIMNVIKQMQLSPILQPTFGPPMVQPTFGPPIEQLTFGLPIEQPIFGPPIEQPAFGPPLVQPTFGPPIEQPTFEQPIFGPPIEQATLVSMHPAKPMNNGTHTVLYTVIPGDNSTPSHTVNEGSLGYFDNSTRSNRYMYRYNKRFARKNNCNRHQRNHITSNKTPF
ncbi:uncharacterized protein LOC121857100 [Homarus americanus]|uniref:uncharacterized protein LOC121857100 n=1 Tax=Homarus americanus TaxID=6706 RepID=UPI001C469982|nr:uncharacterized protein LOC121857100 [Homarus americanus]